MKLLLFFVFITLQHCQAWIFYKNNNEKIQVKQALDKIRMESVKRLRLQFDSNGQSEMLQYDEGTECTANRKILNKIFENDIVLTAPQAQAILTNIENDRLSEENGNKRPKRQAAVTINKWTMPTIPYTLNHPNAEWQDHIEHALQHIENQTCIRFERLFFHNPNVDHIEFIFHYGCFSHLGRVGGRQAISIGEGCKTEGTIQHEILHTLGFWHEQSRSDRDNYINILQENIQQKFIGNFEKTSTSHSVNYGQPYDIGSVMHYSSRAFSHEGNKHTIETKNSLYQQTLGQRKRLTYKDTKMINIRYCIDKCPTKLDCINDGYTNPNNCSECLCSEGYTGKYCEQILNNTMQCNSGDYIAEEVEKVLRSPKISTSTKCFYRIKTKNSNRIELIINKLNFHCDNVCNAYVEIKYMTNKIATGPRLCCKNTKKRILSEGSDVLIIFYNGDKLNEDSGFELSYKIIN